MGFADGVSNKLSTSSRQRLRNVSGSTNGGAHKPNISGAAVDRARPADAPVDALF